MKFSRGIMLACAVALAAVVVTATASGGATAPTIAESVIHGSACERHRQVHRQGLQPEPAEGPERRRRRSWASARSPCSRTRRATTRRTSTRRFARARSSSSRRASCSRRPMATYAKKFPNVDFAITDYTVHTAPFADKKGKVLPAFEERRGPDVHGERVGLPRRRAGGQDGHEDGRQQRSVRSAG